LIWTLEKGLGEVWTEQVKIAWVDCYTILSEAMINAAAEADKAAA